MLEKKGHKKISAAMLVDLKKKQKKTVESHLLYLWILCFHLVAVIGMKRTTRLND